MAGTIGEVVVLCGGEKSAGKSYYASCFKLLPDENTWKRFTDLGLVNRRSKSGLGNVIIQGKLVVSGGKSDEGQTKMTQLVSPDGTVEIVQDSPVTLGHCMIKTDENTVLITGGFGSSGEKNTYYQDFAFKTTNPGPEMLENRRYHGCGLTLINGKAVAWVVGGSAGNGILDTTEYLELEAATPTWKEGPKMIIPTLSVRLIPSKNNLRLFSVGGNSDNGNLDSIYKLVCQDSPESCKWEEIDTKLKGPRGGHVVVPIPATLAMQLCN